MRYLIEFVCVLCGVLLTGYFTLTEAAQKVSVIDGDSLRMNGVEIRLIGIDAPEYTQNCYDAQNQSYACGQKARAYMLEMIKQAEEQGLSVECESQGTDRYHRELSVCKAGTKDLNQAMVRAGWAIAYMHSWYEDDQLEAQKEKNGIWQGSFMRPEFYRRLHRRNKSNTSRRR
jgi:endonuclease YncB( thermonuclease family)